MAGHAFAYYGEEADVVVYFDRVDVFVGEFQAELGFEGFEGGIDFVLTDQEAEGLTVAGRGDRKSVV